MHKESKNVKFRFFYAMLKIFINKEELQVHIFQLFFPKIIPNLKDINRQELVSQPAPIHAGLDPIVATIFFIRKSCQLQIWRVWVFLFCFLILVTLSQELPPHKGIVSVSSPIVSESCIDRYYADRSASLTWYKIPCTECWCSPETPCMKRGINQWWEVGTHVRGYIVLNNIVVWTIRYKEKPFNFQTFCLIIYLRSNSCTQKIFSLLQMSERKLNISTYNTFHPNTSKSLIKDTTFGYHGDR